jgi:hypothetical protein
MSLVLSGTDGLSDIDGSAATPAIRGTDANTGIFFPAADTIAFSEGGAEAMRINSSGQVGIGTDTVATNFRTQFLGTAGSNTSAASSGTTQAASAVLRLQAGGGFTGTLDIGQGGGTGSWLQSCDTTNLATTYPLLLNPVGGNVGIGTSSPGGKFEVNAASGSVVSILRSVAGASSFFSLAGNGNTVLGTSFDIFQDGANNAGLQQRANGPMLFATNNTERARIDSSGNLLVGTTSQISGCLVSILNVNGGQGGMGIGNTGGTSASTCISFRNSNGEVGFIQTSGSATTFSTSSDYRLKENIAPMTGALAKVALLKPCTYKWNADGSDGEGFIAHELQAVCPSAVTGEKDAVDADGNPKYQGIDTSFLVATLTAAIQEQQALIQSLTDRITALETA